jgi:hypothetical protein
VPSVEIIGIYPVAADEPVHLIEVVVHDVNAAFDLTGFTQPTAGQPRSNWQVPYLEYFLSPSGDRIIGYYGDIRAKPELWRGDMRIAFFFHYLDTARPLSTPSGEIPLPRQSPIPTRLSQIKYGPP